MTVSCQPKRGPGEFALSRPPDAPSKLAGAAAISRTASLHAREDTGGRGKCGCETRGGLADVGADIKAEADDLLQYAAMGASYARNSLNLPRPRVGLLNVGTEEHKGRAELKEAHDRLVAFQHIGDFDYVGFVEGSLRKPGYYLERRIPQWLAEQAAKPL